MSGKPATPPASRVAVPGAPRLLVYVADPRQLEVSGPGLQRLPPDPAPQPRGAADAAFFPPDGAHQHLLFPSDNDTFRAHYEQNTPRSASDAPHVYYKKIHNFDGKSQQTYDVTDSTDRVEYFSISQSYPKVQTLRIDDNKIVSDDSLNNIVKKDPGLINTDFSGVDVYQNRVRLETNDQASCQLQCPQVIPDHNGTSLIQTGVSKHLHSYRDFPSGNGVFQYAEGDKKGQCSGKSVGCVNYQFLEQSVSHQSIVNQSINILNQQVGVGRGLAPQLVRTADGVVLAVVPPAPPAHPPEPCLPLTLTQADVSQIIPVPLGWRRIVSGTSVLYISPSGTALNTLPQLREYLQTAGTCKCGLPCPLRPETAFSFDPKVASKPYQTSTGPELAKLCNHKRKLLAALQGTGNASASSHIVQRKGSIPEVPLIKKKMKKPGYSGNMTVSQLMVQRERYGTELKVAQKEGEPVRTVPPAIGPSRINSQSCPPVLNSSVQQAMTHSGITTSETGQNVHKTEFHMHRNVTGSHYLTVNNGWINQPEPVNTGHKQYTYSSMPTTCGPTINVGQPVLGTNGQIIGVNTGVNKPGNMNYKNLGAQHVQHDQEYREDKKMFQDLLSQQNPISPAKQSAKDDESQIFCGLNQPLTPEVMQKINEQQQIFIQQNQKQIEMAMKEYRSQMGDNNCPVSSKSQSLNQYTPQNQLIIQNGAVMKSNNAKTPPWQVKRNETHDIGAAQNSKVQNIDKIEYDDVSINVSDDSSSITNTCNNIHNIPNNDPSVNQMMCSRVPPLPQHYTMMNQQWHGAEFSKKKVKSNNKTTKKKSTVDNKSVVSGANGMRPTQDNKGRVNDEMSNNNPIPSFMDDPNGYLAQQTVLLNNTISRQVGISAASYENNQYDNQNSVFGFQPQNDKSNKTVKTGDNSVYRSNVPNSSPSPNNTPDSSISSDKSLESNNQQCCKGCTVSRNANSSDNYMDSLKRNYVKQGIYHKLELESNSATSSPRHTFDESPVTSSTYADRSTTGNDKNGPIQAATVSTSNVSPMETLLPPEPSPTPSNSSRSTDTPHSNNGGGSHFPTNCNFPMQSPVYSNPGSCSNYNSNPPTPGSGQSCSYNSPGPPNIQNPQAITGTQMMHFISNHNVNKNLMEVDNISLVGVKPGFKSPEMNFKSESKKGTVYDMPGYCPPPHLGGGPSHSLVHANYIQSFVTTMASGFSVTRNTVTSVLAGKAQTATTSINASTANFIRAPVSHNVNLATSYAIPNNQPDPFLNSVNLPTSYPLHIAGTTAQNMISRSPLEMVQNVIGNIPTSRHDAKISPMAQSTKKPKDTPTIGHCQIYSSTGQIIVSNNSSPMPPPPPKTTLTMSPVSGASVVTNVTASVNHVMPAMGGVQQVVNQPTVLVNTLQSPFMLQPPLMAMDGQVVPQNAMLPQIMTGGLVTPTHSPNVSPGQSDLKSGSGYLQGVAMLSPESMKKKNKKKKNHANVTNVLHITAPQQNANNLMVQNSSPQHNTSPQFSPRGFQLSPNNITSAPMLQALTIVPGKSGTPAHIVMNGQGNSSNFGSQQIITNTSPTQQINLLQPVNLINNGSGVMSNFPAFQQFLVPNLGSMVMTADGTAIIQENSSGVPMQLQLQTVNGQNVLTPVQNPGVFTAGTNAGVVIRAQNQQGKIIQSQHSPGAQFLSPNSSVMMSSPNFNGQMSPLLANLSPQNVTFTTSPHHVRSGNAQGQELVQPSQMGQTLMVPLSPKPVAINSNTNNRGNSTFVQQNTTIVQQQTTLVSNQHNNHVPITPHLHGATAARLSLDPNLLLSNAHKQVTNQMKGRHVFETQSENTDSLSAMAANEIKTDVKPALDFVQSIHSNQLEPHERSETKTHNSEHGFGNVMNDGFNQSIGQVQQTTLAYSSHVRHSVSTQTLVNQQRGKSPNAQQVSGSSPPDTTTHSPLGALEGTPSPRLYGGRSMSTQGNYADTTTKSPEPADANSSAMVQCVSSSEQDMAESRDSSSWSAASEFTSDDAQNMLTSNMQLMRHNRNTKHIGVESNEIHYNQTISVTSVNNQQSITITPTGYYDRSHSHKRKNEFGDSQPYRADKMMRTTYGTVHGPPKEMEFDQMIIPHEKTQKTLQRHFPSPGGSSDGTSTQKMYERHISTENEEHSETKSEESEEVTKESETDSRPARQLDVGQLVWGPVKGYASWPGKLVARRPPGHWLVRWFGGRPPSAVDAARLLTLTEGLEAHHAARTKHRKSRKLNTHLENAIQEAMAELDKNSESGGEKDKECIVMATVVTEESDVNIAVEESEVTRRPARGRRGAPDKPKKLTPSAPSKTGLRSAR